MNQNQTASLSYRLCQDKPISTTQVLAPILTDLPAGRVAKPQEAIVLGHIKKLHVGSGQAALLLKLSTQK